MKIDDLRHVVATADWKSIRLAANTLGVDQSTLSRRIRALEDDIGVSLFERYSGGVRTTAAGQNFIRSARRALEYVDQAIADARLAGAGQIGVLHLGAWSIGDGLLKGLVGEFRRRHPDVAIRVTEGDAATLFSQLLERRLDVAICADRDCPAACDSQVLWEERLVLAIPSGAGLCGPITWAAVQDRWCLTRTQVDGLRLQAYLSERGAPPLKLLVQNCSRDSLLSLVAAGVGVLPILQSSAQTICPGVAYCEVGAPEITVPVRLCWLPTSDHPPLRRFVSLARRITKEYGASRATAATLDASPE